MPAKTVEILIADDEAIIAAQLEELLKGQGYHVTGKAFSAAETLRLAKELQPDLVLLEIVLPSLEQGAQTCRHLQEELGIPVILLTAKTGQSALRHANACHPYGIIIKPYQEAQVQVCIESALRRLAEEREQKTQARHRIIFQQSPLGIFRSTLQGRFLEVNPALARMLGYDSPQTVLTEIEDISRDVSLWPRQWEEIVQAAQESPDHAIVENLFRRRDGKVFAGLLHITLVRDANGNPLFLEGILEDITEHKRMEQALKKSEQQYRLLAENMADVVWTAQLAKDNTLRLSYVSPSGEEVFGYTPQEALGKPLAELMAPEHRYLLQELVRVRLAADAGGEPDNEPKRSEFLGLAKDGSRLWLEAVTTPLRDAEGRYVGAQGVTRDISARKAAEEELRKANAELSQAQQSLQEAKDSAEAASRAKSSFLAAMSHDIRTPMNGILGMLQLLQDTELSQEQLEYLQMAQSAGKSLLSIINDVIDISKIEAGKLELSRKAFCLSQTVAEVLDIFAHEARSKGCSLEHAIAPQTPDELIGDPDRLRQVLLNLVGNAVKFTKKGWVELSVSPQHTPSQAAADQESLQPASPARPTLLFTVRDTGPGIAAEKIDAMFETFTRGEPGQGKGSSGSGLGLAIVKRLVERMQGSIVVESEPAEGTSIHVSLPFELSGSQDRSKDASGRLEPTARTGSGIILLVEDDPASQKAIRQMLRRMGHLVVLAQNAQEGLGVMEHVLFDLVLLDIRLPGMDGKEMAQRIRSCDEPVCSTPIVALTAYAMAGDKESFLEAGMDGYLAKPVQQAGLQEIVQAHLVQRSRNGEQSIVYRT